MKVQGLRVPPATLGRAGKRCQLAFHPDRKQMPVFGYSMLADFFERKILPVES